MLGSFGPVFRGPFSSILTAVTGALLGLLLIRPFYSGTQPNA